MKGWRKTFQSVKIAQQDDVSDAVKVIAFDHDKIHDKQAWLAIYSALKDSTETIEVRIYAPAGAKRVHMILSIDSALAATAELWKNTTKTDVIGNRVTPVNRDFTVANKGMLTICHTPGGAQAGTADIIQYIGSASVNGKTDTGGGTSSRAEFLLAPGTAILIKVTSRANGNAISVVMDWYEHEPVIEPE